jgi:hypothetical protein
MGRRKQRTSDERQNTAGQSKKEGMGRRVMIRNGNPEDERL